LRLDAGRAVIAQLTPEELVVSLAVVLEQELTRMSDTGGRGA